MKNLIKISLSLPFVLIGIVFGYIWHSFYAGWIFGENALNNLANDTQRK